MPVINWQRALKLIIVLISIHSFLLGIAMLFSPRVFTEFFGVASKGQFFWQSQSGIFLFILAIAYYLAYREIDRSRILVNFLVLSKALAAVFLLTHWIFFNAPDSIALAAAGDGIMGTSVLLLNIKSPLQMRG